MDRKPKDLHLIVPNVHHPSDTALPKTMSKIEISKQQYGSLLMKLNKNLRHQDVTKLKFLCAGGSISDTDLTKSKTARDIFNELDRIGVLSPKSVVLLAEMMHRIGRKDIKRKLLQPLKITWDPGMESGLDRFRCLLFDVSQDARREDLETMKDLLLHTDNVHIDAYEVEGVESTFDLFDLLINSAENIADAEKTLRYLGDSLNNHRILKKIEEYEDQKLKREYMEFGSFSDEKFDIETYFRKLEMGSFPNSDKSLVGKCVTPRIIKEIWKRNSFDVGSDLYLSEVRSLLMGRRRADVLLGTSVATKFGSTLNSRPVYHPAEEEFIAQKLKEMTLDEGKKIQCSSAKKKPFHHPTDYLQKLDAVNNYEATPLSSCTTSVSSSYEGSYEIDSQMLDISNYENVDTSEVVKHAQISHTDEYRAQLCCLTNKCEAAEFVTKGNLLRSPPPDELKKSLPDSKENLLRSPEADDLDKKPNLLLSPETEKLFKPPTESENNTAKTDRALRSKEQMNSPYGTLMDEDTCPSLVDAENQIIHALRTRMFDQDDISGIMYKMDSNPRGRCLIFANGTFNARHGGIELKNREGNEKDVEDLTTTFKLLNFEVNLQLDREASEIRKILKEYQNMNHLPYDCFACIFVTHGSLGKVYASDGNYLEIGEIIELFKCRNCPSLSGKPKLFIINACQGQQWIRAFSSSSMSPMGSTTNASMGHCHMSPMGHASQATTTIEHDAPDGLTSQGLGTALHDLMPNESDIFLLFGTVPGFFSIRSKTTGSWFITILCLALRKYYKRFEISILIRFVNMSLNKKIWMGEDGEIRCQLATPMDTLTKLFFFSHED